MNSEQSAVGSRQEQEPGHGPDGPPADCRLPTADWRRDWAALALIALSMLRIASTWTVFSATVDEPMHISAGLQLYTRHVYTYQPENPPLPRLVLALAPWLAGMDFDPSLSEPEQLVAVFYSDGHYERNLVLARAGNLLFFLIASLATWWWARREFGATAGLVATLLFTFQPMVVGHSGLATHDAAATAGVAVSLLAFSRWLELRTIRSAALFGVAFGFAVLCKFSCIGYVPAACVAMFLLRRDWRWRTFAVAVPVSLFVIWVGYGFTVGALVAGIRGLAAIDRAGSLAFLFGEGRTTGWWWYFPIAVALKSTIASLVLALFTRRRGFEALAAATAILLVAMPSSLDLGVRYVLPLYAPLAVAGAAALVSAQRSMQRRWLAIALLVWHTGASVIAHPDAFPYFNEAAGREPWRLLLDSNLDWGQDVLRLRDVVREKKITQLGHAVFGWHNWDALGFPSHYPVQRDVPTHGWIAVSEHIWGIAGGTPWLQGRRYERVGKSIRLYYVP